MQYGQALVDKQDSSIMLKSNKNINVTQISTSNALLKENTLLQNQDSIEEENSYILNIPDGWLLTKQGTLVQKPQQNITLHNEENDESDFHEVQGNSSPQNMRRRLPLQQIEMPEESNNNTVVWTEAMIKLILVSYKKNMKLYDKRMIYTKKQVYENLSKELLKFKYVRSSAQVETKIKNLESKYKQRVDNKSAKKSGRGRLSVDLEK